MINPRRASLAFVFLFGLGFSAVAQDRPLLPPLVQEAQRLVSERFYDPAAVPVFARAAGEAIASFGPEEQSDVAGLAIARGLAALNVSHTGRFTADSVDYYELLDVFRGGLRRDLRRLFPNGRVTYDGIGLIAAPLGAGIFATDVYDGSPAAKAGIRIGDEILAVDGQPFRPVESFRGRAGKTVALTIRRKAGAATEQVEVTVARLQPTETLVAAIRASARVIETDGRRLGYIRLWTYHHSSVADVLAEVLSESGTLAGIDGLVLDLRGRWGGAPPDAADMFLGGAPTMTVTNNKGETEFATFRWRGPLVAVIDGGTRSGMEVLSYALQKHGVPLVGETTAGALLAGQAFMLSDHSLLELAVLDVRLDGERIEGTGIAPSVPVPFDIRYADGSDPQLDEAVRQLANRLEG